MPNHMSTSSIVVRTLLVVAGFFLLAWLCTACSAPVGDVELPPLPPTYTSCTTVSDAVANDDCRAGQLSVTRCSGETENPDTDHCTGPRTNTAQVSGAVWCCTPPQGTSRPKACAGGVLIPIPEGSTLPDCAPTSDPGVKCCPSLNASEQ